MTPSSLVGMVDSASRPARDSRGRGDALVEVEGRMDDFLVACRGGRSAVLKGALRRMVREEGA